jgi:hypothetical protein
MFYLTPLQTFYIKLWLEACLRSLTSLSFTDQLLTDFLNCLTRLTTLLLTDFFNWLTRLTTF